MNNMALRELNMFEAGFFDSIMDTNPVQKETRKMTGSQLKHALNNLIEVEVLPVEGMKEGAIYKELTTSEVFIYEDGNWSTFNPYTFKRGQRKILIVDDASLMPSLSEEQLRSGASVSLAVNYAVRALQHDLYMIKKHGMFLTEMMQRKPFVNDTKDDIKRLWLQENHTLLVRLLRTVVLTPEYYREVQDGLAAIKVTFLYDTDTKQIVLKMNEFSVTL